MDYRIQIKDNDYQEPYEGSKPASYTGIRWNTKRMQPDRLEKKVLKRRKKLVLGKGVTNEKL